MVNVSEKHAVPIFRLEVKRKGGGSRVREILIQPTCTRHHCPKCVCFIDPKLIRTRKKECERKKRKVKKDRNKKTVIIVRSNDNQTKPIE